LTALFLRLLGSLAPRERQDRIFCTVPERSDSGRLVIPFVAPRPANNSEGAGNTVMDLIGIFILGVFVIAAELWLLKTRPTESRAGGSDKA